MAKYFTQLSNSTPQLIEVNLKLTSVELAKIRRLTDSKPSDSIQNVVRKLIDRNTNKSFSKIIK